MAYANKPAYRGEASLSFDASMTSNDFAANLYNIEVTFVTEAYGIPFNFLVGLHYYTANTIRLRHESYFNIV